MHSAVAVLMGAPGAASPEDERLYEIACLFGEMEAKGCMPSPGGGETEGGKAGGVGGQSQSASGGRIWMFAVECESRRGGVLCVCVGVCVCGCVGVLCVAVAGSFADEWI